MVQWCGGEHIGGYSLTHFGLEKLQRVLEQHTAQPAYSKMHTSLLAYMYM